MLESSCTHSHSPAIILLLLKLVFVEAICANIAFL